MSVVALSTSPRRTARLAAVFYLLNFLTGFVALGSTGRLLVRGNAAATGANILAHPGAYQLGYAAWLLVAASYVVVTALFYLLFRPVSRSLSLTAAFFGLVGCAIQGAICLFLLAPPYLLAGTEGPGAFSVAQLQELSATFFRLFSWGFNVALVFFGCYCLLIGRLVYSSTFMPRALGALMVLAGLGWLTFLVPSLAAALSPYILIPGIVGEGSLTLWLLTMGVDEGRWLALAGAARAAPAPLEPTGATLAP